MSSKHIHVVAAVIYDAHKRQILIAQRPSNKHQGGKWEFPGGKVETGESASAALKRELYEEIGIQANTLKPLIQIHHDYPDKSILLDVWEVTDFSGEAYGKEGQAVRWVNKTALDQFTFPEANKPILQAIKLPELCLITPEPNDESQFLAHIEQLLSTQELSLIQFRAKTLSANNYLNLAEQLINIAHQYQAKVILNSPPKMLDTADGLHLTSAQLLTAGTRPTLASTQSLSASCHNPEELKQAMALNADFAFLSPIQATTSHPGVSGIGWQTLQQYSQIINIPIYALGGLGPENIAEAKHAGAQGIAAISRIWGL